MKMFNTYVRYRQFGAPNKSNRCERIRGESAREVWKQAYRVARIMFREGNGQTVHFRMRHDGKRTGPRYYLSKDFGMYFNY